MSKDSKNKKNPLLEVDEPTSEEKVSEEVLEEEVDGIPEEGEAPIKEPTPDQEDSEEEPVKEPAKNLKKAVEANTGSQSKNVDMGLMSDAQRTKHITDNEKQIMFMVPLAQGENSGATHECFINGQKYVVQKGVMVQLPESVATLLANHFNVTLNAGANMLIDGDKEKEKALG